MWDKKKNNMWDITLFQWKISWCKGWEEEERENDVLGQFKRLEPITWRISGRT